MNHASQYCNHIFQLCHYPRKDSNDTFIYLIIQGYMLDEYGEKSEMDCTNMQYSNHLSAGKKNYILSGHKNGTEIRI